MSFEQAITVDSIHDEYEYIATQKCSCGGAWKRDRQSLIFDAEKVPFDRIEVQCGKCGKAHEYWFNCSRFFGKPPVFD